MLAAAAQLWPRSRLITAVSVNHPAQCVGDGITNSGIRVYKVIPVSDRRGLMDQSIDTWWHELNTWNALESRNFYRRTLGWNFEKVSLPDGEPYWIARKDGAPWVGYTV
jgi:hypothetical protein